MYTIPEVDANRVTVNQCFDSPRVFFSIYYKVADSAFKIASNTWKKVVKKQEDFREGFDIFLECEVSSEREFKNAWTQVYLTNQSGRAICWVGNIFSHASKQTDGQDGLEFKPAGSEDGTVSRVEIKNLEKLPWSRHGYLHLSGCNTGLVDERGWCPARVFSGRQKVLCFGQSGYAYFSKNWQTYIEKSASDKTIALWAYRRGKNGLFGSGGRMPAIPYRSA